MLAITERTPYMRYPFNNNFEFEPEDSAEIGFPGISRQMLGLLMEDEKNRESKVAPDTSGVDKYFVEEFITMDIQDDFWVIARDFLNHHYPRLKEFHDLSVYGNDKPEVTDTETALQTKVFNVMYNAAKSGDAYSIELMKNLYKTYHKKEYKQLKRFSKITVSEIFSLSETEDLGCDFYIIARIMRMCVFYGIELEDKCSLLYLLLAKKSKELEEDNERKFLNFPEGMYKECYAQVEEWMQENANSKHPIRELKQYWKADRFAEVCLQRQGYPEDYLYRCNIEFHNIEHLLAQTLALLKTAFPKEEFTFEQVQTTLLSLTAWTHW